MKSKVLSDLQGVSDDPIFSVDVNEIGASFIPSSQPASVAISAPREILAATMPFMPALANALPLDVDRAGEPRQAVARSVQDRWDVSEFDKCEIAKFEIDKSKVRPDAPRYNHRRTVVVASVWLALYVIVVIYHVLYVAFGSDNWCDIEYMTYQVLLIL